MCYTHVCYMFHVKVKTDQIRSSHTVAYPVRGADTRRHFILHTSALVAASCNHSIQQQITINESAGSTSTTNHCAPQWRLANNQERYSQQQTASTMTDKYTMQTTNQERKIINHRNLLSTQLRTHAPQLRRHIFAVKSRPQWSRSRSRKWTKKSKSTRNDMNLIVLKPLIC